jgi:L-ascorbate metabolism protein UlaG (beta-lactamase superfamily)
VIYERLFPRWRPDEALRPRGKVPAAAARVTWLGTASHVLEIAGVTLLCDPFVTRPGLLRTAATRLRPNEDEIARRVPSKVDAVLCGHSHYDHLLDAPLIARRTGALLVGSRTTCAFGRASGVPESQLAIVPETGATVRVKDVEIRFVRSRHGRIRPVGVPFPGEALRPRLPARLFHYRMGGAFGVLVRADGVAIYHNGSADLVDAELDDERADVLLVGLAGRTSTRNYVARLARALAPKLIVPTHHDAFFSPLSAGVHLLPRIDLDGFVRDARSAAPDARIVTPDYFEVLGVPRHDASRSTLE